jgi:GT2 family glycosyltransferase
MISVIVSTRKNSKQLEPFITSLDKSIGIDYELILIENEKKYSLAKAYNMGVERAKYDYLCFVHDDVFFKITNWGERLISLLKQDPTIGLVGVAGNKFKSTYPSALGQSLKIRHRFMRGHIYHWETEYTDFDQSVHPNEIDDVVCVDGVFLFTKREVFQYCRFDEELLTHFHGYDIDFSLQVFFKSYRVIVDRGILLDHHSSGDYSKQNTIANRKIGKKWMSKLPVATSDAHLSQYKLHCLDVLNWMYFMRMALKRKLHIIR